MPGTAAKELTTVRRRKPNLETIAADFQVAADALDKKEYRTAIDAYIAFCRDADSIPARDKIGTYYDSEEFFEKYGVPFTTKLAKVSVDDAISPKPKIIREIKRIFRHNYGMSARQPPKNIAALEEHSYLHSLRILLGNQNLDLAKKD